MVEPEREQSQTPKGVEEKPLTPHGTEGEKTPEITPPKTEDSPGKGGTPSQDIDYKKKFSESAAENQRIMDMNAKLLRDKEELESKLVKASDTPSEEELAQKYPDWEYKEDAEKETLRKEEAREKRLRRLEENIAWDQDFKSIVKQEEFASLKDREDEFKEFAYKYPRQVDLSVLAKSFLYKPGKAEPEIEQPPRPGLEAPSSGGREAPRDQGMTLEDVTRLRTENPKLYIKMIREGKIKDIPTE